MSLWQWDSPHAHRNTQKHTNRCFPSWHTNNHTGAATVCSLKRHFHVTRIPSTTASFTEIYGPTIFFSPLFSSLSLFYFLPILHRCEQTRLVRFLPSMPLAQQHHGATVLTTGRLLALALFLTLQVKCSDKIPISSEAELPRALFSYSLFISNLLFLAAILITWVWAQIHSRLFWLIWWSERNDDLDNCTYCASIFSKGFLYFTLLVSCTLRDRGHLAWLKL